MSRSLSGQDVSGVGGVRCWRRQVLEEDMCRVLEEDMCRVLEAGMCRAACQPIQKRSYMIFGRVEAMGGLRQGVSRKPTPFNSRLLGLVWVVTVVAWRHMYYHILRCNMHYRIHHRNMQ